MYIYKNISKTQDQVKNSFPWLVSIENEHGEHICGGNIVLMKLGYILIAPIYILMLLDYRRSHWTETNCDS